MMRIGTNLPAGLGLFAAGALVHLGWALGGYLIKRLF